jgi:homoserine dehydrogenase
VTAKPAQTDLEELGMSALDTIAPPVEARLGSRAVREARVALLGYGLIGSAVSRLLRTTGHHAPSAVRITGALVRTPRLRTGDAPHPLVNDPAALFDPQPDVVIELLGGLEPARTLVLDALNRGIPVVTANKRLLAAHGDELLRAAARSGAPLRYEASVIAGVPFLGTFVARPLTASVDRLVAIVNGTSNYLLTRIAEGLPFDAALADAQRLGFAETDPSRDVNGSDAADKLAVLARTFWNWSVTAGDVATTGVDRLSEIDLALARDVGGSIKPVAIAERIATGGSLYVGPAFVHARDALAGVDGVLNAIRLEREAELPLLFTGPGAGPDVTARTVVDDVFEVLSGGVAVKPTTFQRPLLRPIAPTGWFISLSGALPPPAEIADLFGSHGLWARRWTDARPAALGHTLALLTHSCSSSAVDAAISRLTSVAAITATVLPTLEIGRE